MDPPLLARLRALIRRLTVTEAAASGPTLRLPSWVTVPQLPPLLGFQVMCWWVFRGRVDNCAPVYW